jgi:hypothetical protein
VRVVVGVGSAACVPSAVGRSDGVVSLPVAVLDEREVVLDGGEVRAAAERALSSGADECLAQ